MCKEAPSNSNDIIIAPTNGTTVSNHKPLVYFSIGKLRFGHHGILATSALIITLLAYLTLATPIMLCSMLLTTMTAWDARSLMSQVPIRSTIVPGITAPHREAFQRTMSIMYYANVRMASFILQLPNNWVHKVLLGYMWTLFLPLTSSLENGNTFIFVIPMFIGVTLDIYQAIVLVPPEMTSSRSMIDVSFYLLLQLSALGISFFFTLAFRGYIKVQYIYFISALMVAGIFGGGVHLILLGHKMHE